MVKEQKYKKCYYKENIMKFMKNGINQKMIKKLWSCIIIKNGEISLKKYKIVYRKSLKKKLKYQKMIIK